MCEQLKAGKRDGSSGLVSDHFINACEELSVHTAMLFSTTLVHGFATEDMVTCTLMSMLLILAIIGGITSHIW